MNADELYRQIDERIDSRSEVSQNARRVGRTLSSLPDY